MKKAKWTLFQRRTLSNLFVILCGIGFYLFFTNYTACAAFLYNVYNVLLPFIAAFCIAFVLNAPIQWFERRLAKVPYHRAFSVLITYLLAFGIVAGLIAAVMPELTSSGFALFANMQEYLAQIENVVASVSEKLHIDAQVASMLVQAWEDTVSYIVKFLQKLAPQVFGLSVALGNGIMQGFMAIIASVYMLLSKNTLKRQTKKFLYAVLEKDKSELVIAFGRRANSIFSGFINGKVLDSSIVGVLCFFLMSLFNLPFAVLISIIIAITDIIPFFGPFIGAIPSIIILLIINPWDAVVFAILILVLQQFDGNIIAPKILGDSTGLSPIWVLVAISVGGGLFGFMGMLIGVPAFAVLYAETSDYINRRLEQKGVTKTETGDQT